MYPPKIDWKDIVRVVFFMVSVVFCASSVGYLIFYTVDTYKERWELEEQQHEQRIQEVEETVDSIMRHLDMGSELEQ